MNTFGTLFKVSIFGESHGNSIGVMMDGVPAGIKLSEEDFLDDLDKRKPKALGTTPRKESDYPHIISGVFNGYTTGSAIVVTFENNNVNDKDYSNLVTQPRPGHSDYTASVKYKGFNDYRGGGPFSGRLTLGFVVAGVVAKKILKNINITSELVSIHGNTNKNEFEEEVYKAMENRDSVGGTIRVTAHNVEKGLGEPYFNSVESCVSHIMFSIPAVKGVSFGVGFSGEKLYGSEYNDLIIDEEGTTRTNNNGGINGGITNGNDIICNVFIKPTPSISHPQETFDFKKNEISTLEIIGRHDSCIALRAKVVVESALAIALADLYLIEKAYK
ncbi:MAG: chorismate synthase [Acholeplasmatales bacterium]|nr:chorismate synthase [Acholeplasmatales bacterium]